MATQIRIKAISNTGRVRQNNEDNLYVDGYFMEQDPNDGADISWERTVPGALFAICDGMGGEKSGEKASYEAVSRLAQHCSPAACQNMRFQEKLAYLNRYVAEANSRIHDLSTGLEDLSGMGTTFACLAISEGRAAAMNVGDSRVYLLRDGMLKQLTNDHSEAERLVKMGIITKEQARTHKGRYVLTKHLGLPPEEGILEADISETITLRQGDRFLLCSDGLTDMAPDEKIREILLQELNAETAGTKLVEEALENGGTDNVSIIVADILSQTAAAETDPPAQPEAIPVIPAIHRRKRKTVWIILAICILLIAGAAALILALQPAIGPAPSPSPTITASPTDAALPDDVLWPKDAVIPTE